MTRPTGEPDRANERKACTMVNKINGRLVVLAMLAAMVTTVGLVSRLATPAEAAFPGDNGNIVFVRDQGGDTEIRQMGKTILGIKKLTDNSAEDFAPAVSPDGTRIAFTSDRHGNYDVYVMNRNGTGQTRLTSSPASDAYPAFSADGERIVFQSDRDGENDQNGLLAPEIYAMDADGTDETRLTHDAGGAYDPSFSPNGSEIAFTSTRDGNAEIYVMGADGADAKNLTNNPAADVTPDWSPDGNRIAFTSDRDSTSAGHPNLEVFVMRADGAKQRNLTNNSAPGFRSADRDPAFSPDGQKIAFNTYRDGNHEVYVMTSNGSNVENLSKFPSAGDVEPTWSPRQQ